MKYLTLILASLLISFSSCKNETTKTVDGKEVSSDEEAYTSYNGKVRNVAFQDTMKNNKGVEFELTFRGGMVDGSAQIKVRKDGKLLENKDFKADGRVTQQFMHDINGDGEEDYIFYTKTEDPTGIGNLYGVINDNGTIKHIYVSPFLKQPYVTNYFGRDSFYVADGNIYRSFPKYDLNKLNQKKDSGKDWVLTYKYEGKDTIAVSDGVVK